MKSLNLLVIGQGFMGGIAHPNAILQANTLLRDSGVEFVLQCISGTRDGALSATQQKYGFQQRSTNWRAAIAQADVVVVTTPNLLHCGMALEAIRQGKHVVCEKPIGATVAEAQQMSDAATSAGVHNMAAFCYRGAPGALEARRIIQSGRILGESGYFEGRCDFDQDWGRKGRSNHRFEAVNGLGGVILDLGAHQVDLIQWMLNQNVTSVSAHTRHYQGDGEDLRMIAGSNADMFKYAVDAFDATLFFTNGCVIRASSNRTSTGRKAHFPTIVHGNRGGVEWELENQGFVNYYCHTSPTGPNGELVEEDSRVRGWREIHVSNPGQDGHANTDTVPGLLNGYVQYFRWLYVNFGLQIAGKSTGDVIVPDFAAALQVQRVCEAIYQSGKKGGAIITVA